MNHDRLPSIDHSAESGLDPNLFAEAATDQPGEKPLDPNMFNEAVPEAIHDKGAAEIHDILGNISRKEIGEATDINEISNEEAERADREAKTGKALEEAFTKYENDERIAEALRKAKSEAGKTRKDLLN